MQNTEQLNNLYKQLRNYSFIIEKLSDAYLSEEERALFVEKHKYQIGKLTNIRNKISKLEWKNLPDDQKDNYLDKYSE